MGKSTKTMLLETKNLYKTIGSVYCPALQEEVSFNRNGWNHLLYDGHGHRRPDQSLRLRLHIFPWVSDVIRDCPKIVKSEVAESNGNKAKFFELACEVDGGKRNITVVIRKFDVGPYHYFTVRNTRRTKKSS